MLSASGEGTAPTAQKAKKTMNATVVVAVVVLIVVAAAGVIYYSGMIPRNSATTSSATPGLTQRIALGNGSTVLTLDNATYLAYPMPEPFGRLNPHVAGNFSTKGGSVDVLVFNSTGFSAFVKGFIDNPRDGNAQDLGGQNVSTIYTSKGVASGSFDVNIPAVAGTYYILFVNRSYSSTVTLTVLADLVWQLPASG